MTPPTTTVPASTALVRVPLEGFKWPGGIDKALVVLHAEPAEITARYGIGFRHDLDGLDYNLVSVVRLPSGRPVMFIRHYRAPLPGTVVSVDRNDSLAAAWTELQAVLGIDNAATAWQSEFMHRAADPTRTAT